MRQSLDFGSLWAAAVVLVAAGAIGVLLAWQGWRGRGPDTDVIASMVRAAALVDRGAVPRRGNLTDHNSFRPPGLSWLLVPGVAMFDDPRQIELAACALLYVGTLAGVWALGRLLGGTHVAVLAWLFYAWSSVAIYFAHTMQPKAYPMFGVWMMYCVVRWVSTRSAGWFAAACVVCAAGMYVHIEMAILLVALPVAWWRGRPPLTMVAAATALVAIAVMWWPYIDFQRERGFVDLASQLLLKRIDQRGPETVPWCGEDPLPAPHFVDSERDHPGLVGRARAIPELVLMNFESRVPGAPFVLLAACTAGVLLAVRGRGRAPERAQTVAGSLLVTVAILSLLTEPGVPRQQMVWPLEVLMIATVVDRFRPSRRLAAAVALLGCVAINAEVMTLVRHWAREGWSGVDPPQIQAADFRAARCEDERP